MNTAGIIEATLMSVANFFWAITWLCYIYVLRYRNWPPFVAKAHWGVGLICLGVFFAISANIQTMNGSEVPTRTDYSSRCVSAPILEVWSIGLIGGAIMGRQWKLMSVFVYPEKKLLGWGKFTTLFVLVQAVPVTLINLWVSFFVIPVSERELQPPVGWDDATCPIRNTSWATVMFWTYVFSYAVAFVTLATLVYIIRDLNDVIHSRRSGILILVNFLAIAVNHIVRPPIGFYGVMISGNLSMVVFWTSLGRALRAHWTSDPKYLKLYTYGLSSKPTMEELKGALEQQLDVPELRELMVALAEKHKNVELLGFIEAVLERDVQTDYDIRLALTQNILSKYVEVGAPQEVNLPGSLREQILANAQKDLLRTDLFDKARRQVRRLWEDNMAELVMASDDWRSLELQADQTARARERLANEAILPGHRARRASVMAMSSAPMAVLDLNGIPASTSFSARSPRRLSTASFLEGNFVRSQGSLSSWIPPRERQSPSCPSPALTSVRSPSVLTNLRSNPSSHGTFSSQSGSTSTFSGRLTTLARSSRSYMSGSDSSASYGSMVTNRTHASDMIQAREAVEVEHPTMPEIEECDSADGRSTGSIPGTALELN